MAQHVLEAPRQRPPRSISEPSVTGPLAAFRRLFSTLAVRNGLWNGSANIALTALSIAGSVLIVRSISPDEYGHLSYFLWLAGMATLVGTFALPNALTKISSELRGRGAEGEALALARSVFVIVLLVNVLIAGAIGTLALTRTGANALYMWMTAAIILPNALVPVLRSTLWGNEDYASPAITTTLGSVAQLILTILAFVLGWGPVGFFAALLSPNLVQVVGLIVLMRRASRTLVSRGNWRAPAPETIRRYLGFAAPATLLLVFDLLIWQRSGVYFIERFSTIEEVGYYSLGFTAYGMAVTLGWALLQGFYPAISRAYGAADASSIQRNFSRALIVATLFAAPLSFGGLATLPGVFDLLYGPKMAPSVPTAQILFAGLIVGVIAGAMGLTLTAIGKAWYLVRLSLLAAALSVALNLYLTPNLGAAGGAIANLAAQFLDTVLLLITAVRLCGLRIPFRDIIGIIVAAFVSTLILPLGIQQAIPDLPGLGLAVLCGCLFYTLAIWRLGYVHTLSRIRSAM